MAYFKHLTSEDDLTKSPVVFMHIPKTAGTSFIELLQSLYKNVIRGTDNHNIGKKLEKAEDVDVVCGHFDLTASLYYKGLLPSFSSITILRDPIERVISQIYYLKHTPDHIFYDEIKDLSIYDMYNSKEYLGIRYGVSDLQSHLLSGNALPLVQKSKKYQKAVINLTNRFTFFGTTDKLDDFIKLCAYKFGWDGVPKLPVSNVAPATRNEELGLTEKDLNLIKAHNRYDIQLYAWALQIFEDGYRELLDSLELKERKVERAVVQEVIIPEDTVSVKKAWWRRVVDFLCFWKKKNGQESI